MTARFGAYTAVAFSLLVVAVMLYLTSKWSPWERRSRCQVAAWLSLLTPLLFWWVNPGRHFNESIDIIWAASHVWAFGIWFALAGLRAEEARDQALATVGLLFNVILLARVFWLFAEVLS